MISRVLAAAVLAIGVTLVPSVPAQAVGASVTVANFAFTPKVVQVPVGGIVTWNFQSTHTTTSNQGFWDSGVKSSGQAFSRTFASSGAYPYRCTIHASMHGTVNVPVTASGTPAHGWTLKWSTVNGSGATSFDVQVRRPGSATWRPLKTDTTLASAKFNPARSGAYAVRARTTVGSRTSGWSPLKPLTIS